MRIVTLLCTGLLLSACTQQAAQVDSRGSIFYGKNGASSNRYANITPAAGNNNYSAPPPHVISYGTTVSSTAPLAAVSSKDLDAPIAVESAEHSPTNMSQRNLWKQADTKSSTSSSGFIPPVEGKVTAAYGKRSNGMGNDGMIYSAPLGEPVYASSNGDVAYVGNEIKAYGNMVIIKHSDNYNTSYAHLDRMVVSKGSKVKQGQIIGYVGQTGDVSEPELYFALRKGTNTVNPADFLSKQLASSSNN